MSDLLGGDFTSSNDEIDFDRAASAFPDISLDGSGDIPSLSSQPPAPGRNPGSGFSFDTFDTPPPQNDVRVTGDDEIEKFESEFPEINVAPVSLVVLRSQRRVIGNVDELSLAILICWSTRPIYLVFLPKPCSCSRVI